MITVTLSDELAHQFRLMADATGQTLEQCIQNSMKRFLEEMEDQEDLRDAEAALEEYRRNPGKSFTLDDAMVRYGLSCDDLIP